MICQANGPIHDDEHGTFGLENPHVKNGKFSSFIHGGFSNFAIFLFFGVVKTNFQTNQQYRYVLFVYGSKDVFHVLVVITSFSSTFRCFDVEAGHQDRQNSMQPVSSR